MIATAPKPSDSQEAVEQPVHAETSDRDGMMQAADDGHERQQHMAQPPGLVGPRQSGRAGSNGDQEQESAQRHHAAAVLRKVR